MLDPRRLFPTRLFPLRLFPAAAPAAPATAYTLVGPGSGLVGRASSPFALTPDGTFAGTITPDDGGAGGAFAPASLTWSGPPVPRQFLYTAAAPGTVGISATDDATLADPDPLSFTATAPTAATGDPWSAWSLLNWFPGGGKGSR